MREALADGAAVVVLGFRPADPTGYGRLVIESGELVAIREELDATPEQAQDRLLQRRADGASPASSALAILSRIGNDNRKGEFYLTDAIAIARDQGLKTVAIETEEDDVRGINTKAQLAETEAALQRRLRKAALDGGVTLVAPETVFLAADTKFGARRGGRALRGVRPRRHGRGRRGDPLVLASRRRARRQGRAGRTLCAAAAGRRLGENVHIGNFVEVKEATIEDGAKANHLAYIGDARRRRGRQFRRRHHHLQL